MQVAGTSGKVQQTADEDAEGISSDAHGAAITEALGIERRSEVRLQSIRSACQCITLCLNSNSEHVLSM